MSALCRGDHQVLTVWMTQQPRAIMGFSIPCVVVGCALYGFSMGLWRGAEMGIYVALKLPLLIFATLLVNGVINGLFALLLGSGVTMRQSMQFLLVGFAIMAMILGSLSPISVAMACYAPAENADGAQSFHAFSLVFHTALIAYAGVISHQTLRGFLVYFTGNKKAAQATFLAWISGNLFVGAQLSWVLRPFFGSPELQVAFLRPDPFVGTFYEALWSKLLYLFHL